MKHSRKLIGGAAAVVIAAFAGAVAIRMKDGTAAATDATAAGVTDLDISATSAFGTDMPIPVEGAAVVHDTMVLAVEARGQAAAWRTTVVRAQVAGLVRSVPVRENTRVGAGGLLVALDPEEHQLTLDEARALLAQAEVQYQELTLFDDRITDTEARAQRAAAARARTGLEGRELAVQRAEINLRRTRVLAPFAGVVANLAVVPGQHVNAGDELLTLQETDPIRVEVQVLEADVGYLSAGRAASVTFAAFPGRSFAGRIETINPIVEQQTRTARVTVSVRNPGGEVLPGMYARVSLDALRLADRVMVPRSAVLERDRRTMLFVYDGDAESGLAKWRYVTTGAQNSTHIEIVPNPDTDMVKAGEMVLTDGHYTLTHDARVRLTESAAAAGGRPR